MRWLINSKGQTSGPMDESMVQTLVDAGQISPDALMRGETALQWVPLSRTPFARAGAQSVQPELPHGVPKPWFDANNLSLGQALLLLLGVVAAAIGGVALAGHLSQLP